MKIVIQRNKPAWYFHGVPDDSIDYVRSILMSINHHGWIQDINVTMPSGNVEMLTVTMLPQGDVNPIDLAQEVRHTISLHNDLNLVSMDGIRNRIKIPGLKLMSISPEHAATYSVDPAYALFLAVNVPRAATCTRPEIYEIYFMYEESEQQSDEYDYTGTSCTLSHKSLSGGQMNAYNRFAQIIVKDSNLRQKILDDLVHDIRLIVNPDGRCMVLMLENNLTAVTSPTLH